MSKPSPTPSSPSSRSPSPSMKCIQTLQAPASPCPSKPLTTSAHNYKFASSADKALFEYTNTRQSTSSSSPSSPSPSSAAPSPVWSCAWSHDGKSLATAHGRPSYPCVRIWKYCHKRKDWNLSATLRHDHEDDNPNGNNSEESNMLPRTIRAIEFAYTPPNVRYILACASFDGVVRIWEDFSLDSNGNMEKQQLNYMDENVKHDNNHDDPESNIQNREIQANSNGGWENTAQLEGHENEVKDVSWNSTGTLLATCGRDKTIWIWECFLPGTIGSDGNGSTSFHPNVAGTGGGGEGDFECISILTGHEGDVKDVEFTSSLSQFGDGDDILLSASYDDTIKVWAEEDGEWYCALTLGNVHSSTIWSIALSSSGVRMISASDDCSLGIWRFYTINEKRQMMKEKNDSSDKDVDMGMLSDGLWKCVGKLPSAHKQPVYTIHCASSRAGHGRIVSGGGDDSIQIYREVRSSTGTSTGTGTGNDMATAPDAPLFAIDVSVQKAHDGDVNCVRWHPLDGSLLASAGDDGLVKIWKFTQ